MPWISFSFYWPFVRGIPLSNLDPPQNKQLIRLFDVFFVRNLDKLLNNERIAVQEIFPIASTRVHDIGCFIARTTGGLSNILIYKKKNKF